MTFPSQFGTWIERHPTLARLGWLLTNSELLHGERLTIDVSSVHRSKFSKWSSARLHQHGHVSRHIS